MWILIISLIWPDGEVMKLKTQVLGAKADCEMMAKEVLSGQELKQTIVETGAIVEWYCKQEE